MNKSEPRRTPLRTLFTRLAATIAFVYGSAMTVLILSEADVIKGSTWTFVGMGGALVAALSGVVYGYSLAYTSEGRQTEREQQPQAPATTPAALPESAPAEQLRV